MKHLPKFVVFILLTATAFPLRVIASGIWKSFTSSTGFSIVYPENWFRRGISKDRLVIISSKGGAEATLIEHGQALITVMEAEGSTSDDLTKVIDHYVQGATVVSRRKIDTREETIRGCSTLSEVVSREGAVPAEDIPGPVPYFINTEFFCELSGRKYVVVLRNHEGDKRQLNYRQVALRIAKSIHALGLAVH